MATVQMPTGSIVAYGGAVAPTCWLLCDGASYLRTAWPELFAVIGVAFGSDDVDHFNVPDLRDRSPVGVSPGALLDRPTARVLGGVGGEEAHVLVEGELAGHDHGGATGPVHLSNGLGSELSCVGQVTTLETEGHSHSIATSGGDLAHETMGPFQVTEWIIKT